MKGCWIEPIDGSNITSTVANEFLLVRAAKSNQVNYYIPHPSIIKRHSSFLFLGGKPEHPFSKHLTDSMIMEFGQEHPALIEYGNLAMSEIINSGDIELFNAAILFQKKRRRKILIKKFNFLLHRQIQCVPVQRKDVEKAFNLLLEFKKRKHNFKKDFRNSWNDILILATSINRGGDLMTTDNELSRFADHVYAIHSKEKDGFLKLTFPEVQNVEQKESKDIKEYINSGWLVRFRNLGNQAFRSV